MTAEWFGNRGLGRREPTDDRHLQRFSLTAETLPTTPAPLVFGWDWHRGFGRSSLVRKDGAYWFPPEAKWGPVEGGHAICSLPVGVVDPTSSWHFYDQGNTPRCVDYAICRQQSLLNRRRYAPGEIYPRAQEIDEWEGSDYDGTSVRAGEEVVRTEGMWRTRDGRVSGPFVEDGIEAYRWARTVSEVAVCLSPVDQGDTIFRRGYVTLLQSWGAWYPHFVRVELSTVEKLTFARFGDAAVITDR